MPASEPEFEINDDEFTRIFDQYRARIEEITRQTEHGLQNLRNGTGDTLPGGQIEATSSNVTEKPAASLKQPVSTPTVPTKEVITVKESDKILKEAHKQARKILEEAEERTKKEARKKTQAQVDRILSQAQQQAAELVTQAERFVQEERDAAIASTKSRLEQVLTDITEQARRETSVKSAQAINNARERAERMMAEVASAGAEVNTLATTTIERMQQHIKEIENQLQTESNELSRAIAKTRLKIEQITAAVVPQDANVPSSTSTEGQTSRQRLMLHILGDRSNGKNGTEPLFFGHIEIRPEGTAFNYNNYKNLKKLLGKVPGIKQLQESASEKEISALFDITEPLPLLELLRQMPLVEQVTSDTDRDFSVQFKTFN